MEYGLGQGRTDHMAGVKKKKVKGSERFPGKVLNRGDVLTFWREKYNHSSAV